MNKLAVYFPDKYGQKSPFSGGPLVYMRTFVRRSKPTADLKTHLSLVITMRLLLPFLACTLAAASDGGFHEGDTCGVKSSDFFNGYFVGDYLVAGAEGCSLADGQTGC